MEYSSQQYYVKYSDFNIQSEGDNYRMSFSTFLGGNTGELSSKYYGFSKYFRIMGEAGGGVKITYDEFGEDRVLYL